MATGQRGTPAKITIDQSGANTAAIESYNAAHDAEVEIRQVKYLNNVVEQDHRAIKRQVRPMMGFKSFWSAAVTLAGIELMHMIRKGQMEAAGCLCPAQGCSAATRDSRQNRDLTPLVWGHVSPYGDFDLDMARRLDLELREAA